MPLSACLNSVRSTYLHEFLSHFTNRSIFFSLKLDRCLGDIWQIAGDSCPRWRGHPNQSRVEYLAKKVDSFQMASVFASTLENLFLPQGQCEEAVFLCKTRLDSYQSETCCLVSGRGFVTSARVLRVKLELW